MDSRWDERFFSSTRGQIIKLLRGSLSTVDELAAALVLTDNAVRAHLVALERDGLIRQGSHRRRGGKPSFTYELTEAGERLFPRAYGVLLGQLLDILEERIPAGQLAEMMKEVGHRVAAGQPKPSGTLDERVERAMTVLGNLGGLADAEPANGGYVIAGRSCPLSAAVEGSDEACLIAESLLSEVTGLPVRQICDPGPPPRCRFEIPAAEMEDAAGSRGTQPME